MEGGLQPAAARSPNAPVLRHSRLCIYPKLSLMASGKFLCLGNASMAETAQRSKMLHMQPTALGRSENLGIIECYEGVPGVLSPCPKFCSNLHTGVVLSLHSHSSFPVLQP